MTLYKKMKPYYNTGDMLGGAYGLVRPLTTEIKERIDSKIDPVYKLTWKYKQENYSSSCILYYLLEEVN